MKRVSERLSSRRGISVLVVIAALAALAMAAVVLIPYVRSYRERAAATGCAVGLAEAQRKINDAAILQGGTLSEEEAKRAALQDLKDWSELCPSGGDCYVLPDENGRPVVVCAYHAADGKLKTRLNAERALTELREQAEPFARRGAALPDELTLTLNSRDLTAQRVEEEPPIKRGTRSTPDYEGTVALYRADETGRLDYLCYADEDYCAIWHEKEGWMGDSYQ